MPSEKALVPSALVAMSATAIPITRSTPGTKVFLPREGFFLVDEGWAGYKADDEVGAGSIDVHRDDSTGNGAGVDARVDAGGDDGDGGASAKDSRQLGDGGMKL